GVGPGGVDDRAEGTGGEQVVAPADQHPGRVVGAGPVELEAAELVDEGGLAGAGLAADQDEAALLGRLLEQVGEDPQLLVPLEESHRDPTIRKAPARLNGRMGALRPIGGRGQHGLPTRSGHWSLVEAWMADVDAR